MKLFQRDPATALAKAEAQLAATEAKIADLRADRARALLELDDAEIGKLDAALEHQARTARLHQDRVLALRAEVRRRHREQAEAEKAAAIADLERRLDARVAAAQKLEDAVKHLGEALREFNASRDTVISSWPDCLPRPAQTDLRAERVDRELAWALYGAGSPSWDRPCAIPAPTNAGLGITGIRPRGIAGCVAEAAEAFLDRMRRAPLALEEDDHGAAA